MSRIPTGGQILLSPGQAAVYGLKDVWITKVVTISGTTDQHLDFQNVIITTGELHIELLSISGAIYIGNATLSVESSDMTYMSIEQEYQSRSEVSYSQVKIDLSTITNSRIITRDKELSPLLYHPCSLAGLSISDSMMINSYVNITGITVHVRMRTVNISSDSSATSHQYFSGVFVQAGTHSVGTSGSSGNSLQASNLVISRKRRSVRNDKNSPSAFVLPKTTSIRNNEASFATEESRGNTCFKTASAAHKGHRHRTKRQTATGTEPIPVTSVTSEISITEVNFIGSKKLSYDDIDFSALGMVFLRGSEFIAQIENCLFQNNDRGINMKVKGSTGGSLFVASSIFLKNNAKGPGGALSVEQDSGIVTTRVIDTQFKNNIAAKMNPERTGLDVTEISKFSGNGGAMAIAISGAAFRNVRNNIDIDRCVFENNTSENYGGTLYFTGGVGATISNCNMSNVGEGILRPRLGDIVESRGNLYFRNVSLNIQTADDNVAILSYRAEKDGFFMESSELAFYCPKGFQTAKVFNAVVAPNSTRNPIETLLLFCRSCKRGSYTLENSGAVVNGINIKLTTINTCNDCPYGATCDAAVKSKTNFWGEPQKLGTITMHSCPSGYCCQSATCELFNACASNRKGPLCGACTDGYSESMFSTTCVPNGNCSYLSLLWIVLGVYGLCYVLFFVFEDELKLIVQDFGTWVKKRLAPCRKIPIEEDSRTPSDTENSVEESNASDAFLNIFMYYVQASELLKVEILYNEERSNPLSDFQQTLSDVFSFDTLGISSDACLFTDVNAVLKRLFKTGFIVYMFAVWAFLYIVGGLFHYCIAGPRGRIKWIIKTSIRAKFLGALVNLLLYTYQYFAENTFSVLRCVTVESSVEQVLYIDGNVKCYQTWQYAVMAFAAIYVFPFFIVLTLAPALLRKRQISAHTFIISILLPLFGSPYLAYAWCRWKKGIKKNRNNLDSTTNDKVGKKDGTVDVITGILSDPYRTDFCGGLCWEGVSSLKRLLLVLVYTLVTNVLYKQLIIMLICYMSLALQISCKAFATPLSNTIEAISMGILLLISIMNLIKAVYFYSGEVPVGAADTIFIVYDWAEAIALSALPMIILGLLAIALFIRIWDYVIQKCCYRKKEKDGHIDDFDQRRHRRPKLADIQREWYEPGQRPSTRDYIQNRKVPRYRGENKTDINNEDCYDGHWGSLERGSLPSQTSGGRSGVRYRDSDPYNDSYRDSIGGYQTRLPGPMWDEGIYQSNEWPVRDGRHIHTRSLPRPDYQEWGGRFDPFHRGRNGDVSDRDYPTSDHPIEDYWSEDCSDR